MCVYGGCWCVKNVRAKWITVGFEKKSASILLTILLVLLLKLNDSLGQDRTDYSFQSAGLMVQAAVNQF